MDLLFDEVMLYHDETALDRYIEDRMLNPEGRVGKRFSLLPAGQEVDVQLVSTGGTHLLKEPAQ